jgi:hypothetical protein
LIASEPLWVAPEPKPPKVKRLSEFDEKYLRPLLAKYGTNYEAMARDRKLNRDQLSAKRLEKMNDLLKADDASAVDSEEDESGKA